ncbi:hypothetical protein VNO80_21676 [Phaseolus coccineus]|uniref:Protein transport protein Sec61 subunit beta n=1 Tax=Phaseolus coccineus TaxID=3886 RepID=A0AAN9QTJ6_PHACN
MARGASQSQSTASAATTRPGVMAPRGSAAATAGMRRRRLGAGSSSASVGSGSGSGGSNMLRFYTDDAPGLKISPTVVLVMSLCFIGFVTALHVFGKLYRYRSGVGFPEPKDNEEKEQDEEGEEENDNVEETKKPVTSIVVAYKLLTPSVKHALIMLADIMSFTQLLKHRGTRMSGKDDKEKMRLKLERVKYWLSVGAKLIYVEPLN